MKTSQTLYDAPSKNILAGTISSAWIHSFRWLLDQPGGIGPVPLIVRIKDLSTEGVVVEDSHIRTSLDNLLKKKGKIDCHSVANTIFPMKIWNPKADRSLLYKRFNRMWPQIYDHRQNKRGTYFQRMTAIGANLKGNLADGKNQLEHVLETWKKGNHRHSALQIGILNPLKDHVHSKQRGFPCMQQVSFTPLGSNGKDGLRVVGYYPTQYFMEKAYGNYLGLIRLGQFVAKEMAIELRELVCIAIKPQLPLSAPWRKSDLKKFDETLPVYSTLSNYNDNPTSGDGAKVIVSSTSHGIVLPTQMKH